MTKGQRIKKEREKNGFSQTDFAKLIGVSKQTLYKYENDIITNIPSDVVERIALHLGCTPAYIMGWDEQTEKETKAQTIVRKLSDLSPDQLDNVEQYIDFLISKGGTNV